MYISALKCSGVEILIKIDENNQKIRILFEVETETLKNYRKIQKTILQGAGHLLKTNFSPTKV